MTKKGAVIQIIGGVFIIMAVIVGGWLYFVPTTPHCGLYTQKEIRIGANIINAQVADNDCKRILGLSGQKFMDPSGGMLFVYDNEGSRGIWMKEMHFPIDVLWMDEGGVVVGIEDEIGPGTYPKIFGEQFKAKYVLELPAGSVGQRKILLGDTVSNLQ
jgi:hypothetical protein